MNMNINIQLAEKTRGSPPCPSWPSVPVLWCRSWQPRQVHGLEIQNIEVHEVTVWEKTFQWYSPRFPRWFSYSLWWPLHPHADPRGVPRHVPSSCGPRLKRVEVDGISCGPVGPWSLLKIWGFQGFHPQRKVPFPRCRVFPTKCPGWWTYFGTQWFVVMVPFPMKVAILDLDHFGVWDKLIKHGRHVVQRPGVCVRCFSAAAEDRRAICGGLVLNFGISQKCSVYSLLRNCEMFFFYPSCALYDLEFRVNLSTSLDAHVLFNISIIFQLFVYSTTTYYIFGIIGKYHIQLFLLSIKKNWFLIRWHV